MTDLVRDVAADVRPPDFDTLVRRAGRRRARRRAAVIAAAATVAATVAVGVSLIRPSDDARPIPTGPSPTTAVSPTVTATVSPTSAGPPTDAASIVAQGMLVGYAVDGHGGLMTKWQACGADGGTCNYAFRLALPDVLHDAWSWRARMQDEPYGGSSGFLQGSWSGKASDLHTVEAGAPGPMDTVTSGAIGPGTLLVADTRKFALRAADPTTGSSWPLASDCIASQVGWQMATVASDGTVWAVPALGSGQVSLDSGRAAPTTVCSSTDGAHWHVAFSVPYDAQELPGMITSSGGRVALVMTGTGSATVMPVTALWTTTDGAHWRKAPAPPFGQIDSMAATSGGVLFAADADGTLYRSTDWSAFTRVVSPPVSRLEADGGRVAAQLNGAGPSLVTVSGAGTVEPWPTPLR